MQTTKTIDKPYKLPFGGILEHDEKGTSAINSSWQVDELMSVEDDKKDAAAVNSNWRVNELMSIEHDEKNTSAINSSWWVDELMSIEHDEKILQLSTYSLLGLSARPLVNSSATLFCPLFSKKFNTKTALFIHQPLTLPQKIDSREGCF